MKYSKICILYVRMYVLDDKFITLVVELKDIITFLPFQFYKKNQLNFSFNFSSFKLFDLYFCQTIMK